MWGIMANNNARVGRIQRSEPIQDDGFRIPSKTVGRTEIRDSCGISEAMKQIPDRLQRLDAGLQVTLRLAESVRTRIDQYLRPQPDNATAIRQNDRETPLADATVNLDEKLYVVDQIQTILNDVLNRLEI